MSRDRGQLVLLAAVLLALALVPMLLAYLQLGYHDDVGATSPSNTVAEAEQAVEHGVHDSAVTIRGAYDWTEREQAVDSFRSEMEPTIAAVSQARLAGGQAIALQYNETRAGSVADTDCPDGSGRQFGDCVAIDGVVVQERTGVTHVVAVAVDLQLTGPKQERTVTVTLRPTGSR